MKTVSRRSQPLESVYFAGFSEPTARLKAARFAYPSPSCRAGSVQSGRRPDTLIAMPSRDKKGASAKGSPFSKESPRRSSKPSGPADKGGRPSPPTRQLELSEPAAVISRRACDRLRAGHVWVYKSDIEQVLAPDGESGLLPVLDNRGIPMGTALYSASSQIALRLISREIIGDEEWLGLVRSRLIAAIERRKRVLSLKDTDACRIVFSEADDLPGLIADKYGDLVILQLLTRAMDRPEIREIVVDVLRPKLAPGAIVERPDARIRELEEMGAPSSEPLFVADPKEPLIKTIFKLNGLRFHYDLSSGQKTGPFSISARITSQPPSSHMGMHSISAAIKGDLRYTWLVFVTESPESMPPVPHSKLQIRILR